MTNDPVIEFPVIASLRDGRREGMTTWSLKTLLWCLSSIADHATQRAGLRINNHAASKIALKWNEVGEFPSAKPIALAIRSDARFVPLPPAQNTGIGALNFSVGAILSELDGIHRIEACIAALQKATISLQNLSEATWPIHVAKERFTESAPNGRLLSQFHGKILQFLEHI
ncbi:MAG: hypothetical protein NTW21_28430 [Verrucomicrobia bacterium]|nr:hypothetical protein [Verrucomicrobiota bacterium]